MGAIASFDALAIGTALELTTQRGERVVATGVAGGGSPGSGFQFPPPGTTITGAASVSPTTATWKKFAVNGASYSITIDNPAVGVPLLLTNVSVNDPPGINDQLSNFPVTLIAGAGGFTIRDPQALLNAAAATVDLVTPGKNYWFALDDAGVLECIAFA